MMCIPQAVKSLFSHAQAPDPPWNSVRYADVKAPESAGASGGGVARVPTPPDGPPPGWLGNSKGTSKGSQWWMDEEGNWHWWRQVSWLM